MPPRQFWPTKRQSRIGPNILLGSGGTIVVGEGASPGLLVGNTHLAPPLRERERGAILMSSLEAVQLADGISFGGSAEFDDEATRLALLFFDRIDSPANTILQIGQEAPPGLESWPGYQRSRVELIGTLGGGFFRTVLLSSFEALNEREPGRWSVVRPHDTTGLPADALGDATAFKVQLENALPLPTREVSFDEILNYKERRYSELLSLRHHIDDLALCVANQDYGDFAKTVAFEKFAKSLNDHVQAIQEQNFRKMLGSLEISFNWTDAITKLVPAIALGQLVPSLLVPSLIGATASAVSVQSTLGLKKKSAQPNPFDYVLRAGTEL
jgi:Family of unknown function (DUF6236)